MTAIPDTTAADSRQIIAELERKLDERTSERDEALERQMATSDILKVIASSPSDVQPVFEAIATSANRLIGSYSATVFRFVDGICHLAAFTQTTPAADEVLKATFPRPVADFRPFELAQTGKVVQVADTDAETDAQMKDIARARGFRSALLSPLMSKETPIGLITVTRVETGSFAAHHVQLLQTFADQAVIAIENTRLFNETKDALERQTATADILRVIATSPSDVQPVFKAIAERSKRLVNALSTTVFRLSDDVMHLEAFTPTNPEADASLQAMFPAPLSIFRWAGSMRRGEIFRVADTEDELDTLRGVARLRGFRSMLLVPLVRDGTPIGLISVTRVEPGPFANHHVHMLQTFADQALIAIENARLFDEVQAKTRDLTESLEQQTATSEVLQVISTSPGELEPVFRIMLENATRVCGANFGMMQLWNEATFSTAAAYNVPPAFAALREGRPIQVHHPQSGLSKVLKSRRVVHIHDVTKGAAYLGGDPNVVELADIGGARTVVLVPMLKEGEFIGAFTIYRQEVRQFTDKQIALVENFTKQAVIAIENTRLLKELRQRTDDLSTSLDELRTAQDRLIQTEKLASLGQLTAGIAHEIKNPLNFVNNFSAVSAELTDELSDALKPAELDQKIREEVDELTRLLKDNLEKVVQHGKRADSIVKNMLQHSREGSGEHRPADINAIVDESLNLAYHGARAEKTGFSIALQRNLDPSAGMADVYPQEITRVLLNLISNGFYAATKRRAEADDGFEALLSATTKNLGDKIEIRIRDNGTGIPAEIKEKIFNPFFTTKPSGEGTGLGLSMSHDIIVKQHGGSIDVETESGLFTEFKIVLPRTSKR
jgi:two-component system NtrC family sensor kinase